MIAVFAVLGAVLCSARGEDFVFRFDTLFTGVAPVSTASPWLTAGFETIQPGQVRLTIANANLLNSENIDQLYFNLNPQYKASALQFKFVGGSGGYDAPTFAGADNRFKAGGDGKYDLTLTFSQGGTAANRFGTGETLVCELSGIAGLTAADFEYKSFPVGSSSPYFAMAHIQRIGSGSASGWVDPSSASPMTTPEPGSAILGLLGGVLALCWKKVRG